MSRNIRIWIWLGQNIEDLGAKMICEALSNNSTLTKLDMSCYELKEVDVWK